MLDLIKRIVNSYNYSIKAYRPYGIFGFRKAIQIKIEDAPSTEVFSKIFDDLKNEFGDPVFIHSYYGFIFQRNSKFIAYNIIGEGYGVDLIEIFIFNKIPMGNKITFNRYTQVEEIIKTAIIENELRVCNSPVFAPSRLAYKNNCFVYGIDTTDNVQIVFHIYRKKIKYYMVKLKPEGKTIRMSPVCIDEEIVDWNDTASLKLALGKIFQIAASVT